MLFGALAALSLGSWSQERFASVSVGAFAPWRYNDPAVEAAALVYRLHGRAALVKYWSEWSDHTRRSSASGAPCTTSLMSCTLATLHAMDMRPLELRALGAALAARTEAPSVEAWGQFSASHGVKSTEPMWLYACGSWYTDVDVAVSALRTGMDANCSNSVESESADEVRLDHQIANVNGSATRMVAYIDPHHERLNLILEQLTTIPPTLVTLVLHYRPWASDNGVPIQGFGAIIRVKVILACMHASMADCRTPLLVRFATRLHLRRHRNTRW